MITFRDDLWHANSRLLGHEANHGEADESGVEARPAAGDAHNHRIPAEQQWKKKK